MPASQRLTATRKLAISCSSMLSLSSGTIGVVLEEHIHHALSGERLALLLPDRLHGGGHLWDGWMDGWTRTDRTHARAPPTATHSSTTQGKRAAFRGAETCCLGARRSAPNRDNFVGTFSTDGAFRENT